MKRKTLIVDQCKNRVKLSTEKYQALQQKYHFRVQPKAKTNKKNVAAHNEHVKLNCCEHNTNKRIP